MATAVVAGNGAYDPRSLGAKCDACPLKGKKPVPPTIPVRPARFIVVGEAPGRLEVFRGRPFIGPSGALLDKALKKAGLRRHEAHITNAMACMPDDDRPEVKLAATSCCSGRLATELELVAGYFEQPSVQGKVPPILALGAWALKSLLGINGIQKCRGFFWRSPEIAEKKLDDAHKTLAKMRKGAKAEKTLVRVAKKQQSVWLLEARARIPHRDIIPTVHPAFILRGADGWLPIYYNDVRRFARLLQRGKLQLEDIGTYKRASTPRDVIRLIAELRGVLAVDVETSGPSPLQDRLLCVGISDGVRTVEVYPWDRRLAPALRRAFAGRELVMHNGVQFDQIVLKREGVLS